MISRGCRNLLVLCNSGALKAEFIGTLGNKIYYNKAKVGDVIKVAIKESVPESNGNIVKAKKGKVFFALVVATKAPYKDMFGNYVKFAYNAIILLTKDMKQKLIPVGTRVSGCIARGAMIDAAVAVNRPAVNKVLSTAKEVF